MDAFDEGHFDVGRFARPTNEHGVGREIALAGGGPGEDVGR